MKLGIYLQNLWDIPYENLSPKYKLLSFITIPLSFWYLIVDSKYRDKMLLVGAENSITLENKYKKIKNNIGDKFGKRK